MQINAIRPVLLLVALVAAFAMAPVAPEAGNMVFLISGGVALLLLRRRDLGQLARPVVWMPLAAMGLLAITYMLGSGSVQGALGIFFFAPMLAIWPLLALNRPGTGLAPELIAVLALCGVAGAALVGVDEFLATGTARVGLRVANPIHYADVALTVGFVATLGLLVAQGPRRYLYGLGPVCASVAILLSGTRGAVVALVVMIVVAVGMATLLRLLSLRAVALATLAGVVLVGIGLAAGGTQISGVQRVMADIADVLQTGLPTDSATAERLSFYQGGLGAFLSSPLYGVGPFDYTAVAASHVAVPFTVPHLHSDIVDFAASGGVLGLVGYLLFLLAPLVEALRAPPSPSRAGTIVLASTLCAGFFVMGLTNAMFGILNLTVCFAALSLVIGLVARPETVPVLR